MYKTNLSAEIIHSLIFSPTLIGMNINESFKQIFSESQHGIRYLQAYPRVKTMYQVKPRKAYFYKRIIIIFITRS